MVSTWTVTTWSLTQAKPRTHCCVRSECVKEEPAHRNKPQTHPCACSKCVKEEPAQRTLPACLGKWPAWRHVLIHSGYGVLANIQLLFTEDAGASGHWYTERVAAGWTLTLRFCCVKCLPGDPSWRVQPNIPRFQNGTRLRPCTCHVAYNDILDSGYF